MDSIFHTENMDMLFEDYDGPFIESIAMVNAPRYAIGFPEPSSNFLMQSKQTAR